MTHTRRKSLPMLSSGPTGRQEPLQMEGSSMEQGAEETSSLMGTRRSRGGDPHRSRDRDRATGGWASSKKRPRLGDLGGGSRDLSPEPAPDEGARRDGDPAPKRLASLNAAAFLKLSQERELPLRPPPTLPAPDGLCGGPELTALGSFYLYCSQAGLRCGGYSSCSVLPEGKLSPVAAANAGLLLAPSSVPAAGTHFQHPPWGSRYCSSEDTGVNGYSICEMLPPSLTHIGTTCGGCPYKMPFAAGMPSWRKARIPYFPGTQTICMPTEFSIHGRGGGHQAWLEEEMEMSKAAGPWASWNFLSRKLATLPHLLTPSWDALCPACHLQQSLHTARSKAARRPSHPKQPRVQRPRPRRRRRRRTNGWVPVGAACEKAVYVLDEPEPAIRKSYQAVERHGETIRVRDTVLLKSGPRKTSTPYVAKISALWENPESGELMMSLLWYYRPEHLQGGRSPSMHEVLPTLVANLLLPPLEPLQNEVFASRHQDQNSVACIEEKCYVLTFAEYCRFCAMAKRRGEGLPSRKTALVPPSADYSTPPHRTVPEDTDPELVFLCRHVYDFRHGRILKNPQ
ncbi:hypothetical protein E2I00_001149 [Balaenoptera physalus]|uniref:BAH domain-containing protein n=1 Tax=Balaenoptera physalus TaxID=9770 RepID=A0A6A1Q8A3_BALPH|nr:hypothetical protein E2I00_001149 [Balaenoptera physalus]